MNNKTKILGTNDAWESGILGEDEQHARPASQETANQIDEAMGLQLISIRLDKNLIESFKLLAAYHGIGYQPLMRDALKRFSDYEMKSILSGVLESQRRTHPKGITPPKPKKAA